MLRPLCHSCKLWLALDTKGASWREVTLLLSLDVTYGNKGGTCAYTACEPLPILQGQWFKRMSVAVDHTCKRFARTACQPMRHGLPEHCRSPWQLIADMLTRQDSL